MTTDTLRRKAKQAVKSLLPPLLLSAARALLGHVPKSGPAEWEYVPGGWAAQEADPGSAGWDTRSVLEAYQANWPSFLKEIQGNRPFGSDPGGTDLVRQTVLTYAHALGTAAQGRSQISLLDWGGGLGHYFLISRALYPDLEIDYHCKDVPILAQGGRGVLPSVHFYDDETCLARTYEFVFASCSLNYSQDWPRVLSALAGATAAYLLVTRLPIVEEADSYVYVQRPQSYGTTYLSWCLNRAKFLSCASAAGLELEREYEIGENPDIKGAPAACRYRGFLFRKTIGQPQPG